jgi:SAM-dependent methyltransferase
MESDALESADCPVCGPAPRRVWLDDGRRTRYVRCLGCGTVFASPRLSRTSRRAQLAETYAVGDFARRNAMGRAEALRAEAAVLRAYVDHGTIVDVGCDLGDLFAHFAGPGWRRLGVELSPSAAAWAAVTHDADVHPGDLRSAGFDSRCADLVTMLDVFCYVDDPRGELAEAARILKAGGRLAIEFPGQRWHLARSRGPLCWLLDGSWCRLRTDSPYVNWYTPRALRRLMESAGFAVEGIHVMGSPRPGGRLRR